MLVFANGFFVATEFALVSVRRTRMQQLAAEGNRRAHSVLDRLNHLDTYIAATQLGITISSLGLGWIGEPALAHLIEPAFDSLRFIPEGTRDAARHSVAFVFAFAIITTLHIVIGELAPKSLALQRPEETSLFAAGPIQVFTVIFRPVIALLNGVGNALVRLVGIEPAAGHALVQSAEELKLSVDASREAGLVHKTAHDIVDRAFSFTDMDARHIMVPRTEVTAVPVTASIEDIFRIAAETGYVRLPVYERDSDHIVGIVNVKRLLPALYASTHPTNGTSSPAMPPFDLRHVMSEPLAIPETVPATEILSLLRGAHTQIAVVIDEFGGTAGILTLEDLVESLVGEIQDEIEDYEPDPTVNADGSWVLDGLTTLNEAKDLFDLDLQDDDFDVETVGGFVFSSLGRPAEIGDEVETATGQTLVVEELDGLRVARVRVLPRASRRGETEVEASAAVGAG